MSAAVSVNVCSSAAEVFDRAARQVVSIANSALADRSRFVVALSGGSTPRGLYSNLAAEHSKDVAWSKVLFFWSDERTVPPNHDDSNYRMARETLLTPLGIEDHQVFRLRGEDQPENAAIASENAICSVFETTTEQAPPSFDLVLLGVGYDGHIASLFPHTAAVSETKRWVVANEVVKLNTWRLTMTPRLINAARHVMILCTGANKSRAIGHIINGPRQPQEYPGQLVWPTDGTLMWYLDRAAAGELNSQGAR